MGYKSKYFTTSIVGEENEIIEKKDWDQKTFTEVSFAQMLHPHLAITEKFIIDTFNSTNNILYINTCSSKKPYETSRTIGSMYRILESKLDCSNFDRAVISDIGICPYSIVKTSFINPRTGQPFSKEIKYNHMYPYSHYALDSELKPEEEFIKILSEKIYSFIKAKNNYDKIVSVFKSGSKTKKAVKIALAKLKDEGRIIKLYDLPSKIVFDSYNGLECTMVQLMNMKLKKEVVEVLSKLIAGEDLPEIDSYTPEEASEVRKKKFKD